MKKLSLFLSICLLLGLMTFPVSAKTLDNGLMYVIENGEATISNYVGKDTEIVVPAEIDGYPVTAIGGSAFASKNVHKVTLPNTIKVIGPNAFSNCQNLKEINIPNSVTYISDFAFNECITLDGVILPDSLEYLGMYVVL